MADNTAKIAAIDKILESGARQIAVDGIQATVDTDSLRKERRRLVAEDDATTVMARPAASSIQLGGAI